MTKQEESRMPKLRHPVFAVLTSHYCGKNTPPQVICVVLYVDLQELDENQAVALLQSELQERYNTVDVSFQFWSDGVITSTGAPQRLTLKERGKARGKR